ncbi:MAG TPA: hypothetical protein VHL60_09630 [Oxalicibacterium sp.]|jgi:hypothetical protein|nr:hypothetical protein [Oxalicibacterium sp.]
MNHRNIQLRQLVSTAAAAFISGAAFEWLIGAGPAPTIDASSVFGATITILGIVVAFALGERQMYVLWKSALSSDVDRAAKQKEAALAMATTAWKAVEQLNVEYRDTHQDRLRLCAVYHSDTFGGLVEALASIPAYELKPTEAAIALAGLKKNLNELRYLIDTFLAESKVNADTLLLTALPVLDLRACKSYAELHYRKLVTCCQE